MSIFYIHSHGLKLKAKPLQAASQIERKAQGLDALHGLIGQLKQLDATRAAMQQLDFIARELEKLGKKSQHLLISLAVNGRRSNANAQHQAQLGIIPLPAQNLAFFGTRADFEG